MERNFKVLAGGVILAILIIVGFNHARCQYVGLNGQGLLENTTEQSTEWLHELFGDEPFTVRFPGGASAKYADPISGGGWGFNYTIIDTITALYGSAEEEAQEGVLLKWQRKADAQPDYSYLADIVWLQSEFPNMRVIWVANYFISADRAFYPIEYLLNNGVNLVCVEIGNESYSQMDYDFDTYWERSAVLVSMCKALLIPVAFPVPASGIRASRTHTEWINSLNGVLNGEGVVFHPYYDRREFPSLAGTDTALMIAEINDWDYTGQFQEMKAELPNGGFYLVTESNSQPASLIGDTEVNRQLVYNLLKYGRQEFTDYMIHNGVAPDKFGIIYGTPQKRNTSYYAFQDVLSEDNSLACDTTIIPAVFDTVYQTVEIKPNNPNCDRFFYKLFNRKACKGTVITIPVITLVTPSDTVVNCGETGCVNGFGTDPDLTQCRTGNNDDYLHPERFIDPDGHCYCDECGVVFDHRINTKFTDIIIPAVYDATGVWIDTDLIDFYITMNGKTVVFHDVFNWCEDGRPTFFNTNKEVFNTWTEELTGVTVYTFGVQMIDRETGINVAEHWMDHVDMTLYFTGLW